MACSSCARKLAAQAALANDERRMRFFLVKTPEGNLGFCSPTEARTYAREHGYSRIGQKAITAKLIDGEWSATPVALSGMLLPDDQSCLTVVDTKN